MTSTVRLSTRSLIRHALLITGSIALLTVAAVGQTPGKAAATKLPVSMNEVMVALTDRSAEPFWVASQKLPQNQQGWDELEYNAMQIALSGVVISFPGTGAADAGWVGQKEWQDFSRQLTAVGMKALKAAKSKDKATITKTGSELVDVCEGCHAKFKPDIPSQGILMHSEYYRPDRGTDGKNKK